MAKKTSPAPAPLTFDIPVSLLEKIERLQKKLGMSSTSEVVRHAIDEFDMAAYEDSSEEHRQISVRLAAKTKVALVKAAKKHKTSVGELVRTAVNSLPAGKGKK